VVEHIYPAETVVDYLDNAYRALVPGGRLMLSTPIVDINSKGQRVRARNHVHEFSADELEAVVKSAGFEVVDRFGTFASYRDIKRAIQRDYPGSDGELLLKMYDRLREFAGDDVAAGFMAPMFPKDSRNQFLVCRKPEETS